ncbi:BID domain-containing T4SS effector [Bartonella gabonensis]|uniref:BID domain-containing T4SS effector n=1 Tax=Bartonella gabonensis TaxID=2699889 RepID=UPI00158CD860|nr:BID domain-containing T4SS effector [Bartonella gabonensis]
MKKSHPQPTPQNPEPLYATVDKSRKRGEPRIPSPEEIQAVNRRQSPSNRIPSADLGGSGNGAQGPLQEGSSYNTPRTSTYDTPPSQRAQETVYAPQYPPAGTIYAPQYPLRATRAAANRGSRSPSPENPSNPYAVVNLATGETEFEERRNTLYDSPNGSTQDVRTSQRQEEHLYAEIDPRTQSGRAPQQPIETVYASLGMGAEGGQESQQWENPLYESVGKGATPTPPRTAKDVITTRLLQNADFQYGVREIQVWCKTVYGKEHILNERLAKILDNPQDADQVLWDLAAHPESAGKLAGRQVLGIKSPDRKAAEDGFSPLCSALEKHIYHTQKLHKAFTRDLEKERGQRQENPERDEHRHHHHHHRHRHARRRDQESPEHNPQRQEGNKGMAYAM